MADVIVYEQLTENERLFIKYEGNFDAFRLDTLVETQRAFLALVNAVARQVAPELKIEVRVQETQAGSFDLHAIIATTVLPLLQANPEKITTILAVVRKILDFVKFAGGGEVKMQPAPDGNGVDVTNTNSGDGKMNISQPVYNIINNTGTINFVQKFGKSLAADDEVEAFTATLPDTPSAEAIVIPKADFPKLARKPQLTDDSESSTLSEAVLFLGKIDMFPEEHSKWDFYLAKGEKLKDVKIEDEGFLESIRTGEMTFRPGDSIRCTLRTVFKKNPDLPFPIVKGYQVEEVLEYIPKKGGDGFNFGDNERWV